MQILSSVEKLFFMIWEFSEGTVGGSGSSIDDLDPDTAMDK